MRLRYGDRRDLGASRRRPRVADREGLREPSLGPSAMKSHSGMCVVHIFSLRDHDEVFNNAIIV